MLACGGGSQGVGSKAPGRGWRGRGALFVKRCLGVGVAAFCDGKGCELGERLYSPRMLCSGKDHHLGRMKAKKER